VRRGICLTLTGGFAPQSRPNPGRPAASKLNSKADIRSCSGESASRLQEQGEKSCAPVSNLDMLVRRFAEPPVWMAPMRRRSMRVMVFVKATEDSEIGMAPTPEAIEAFAAMGRFTEELVAAGVFVAAAGLKPSSAAKRIAFDGTARTVIDGPFAEARELVAGFFIWEVRDMDEAVAWAKRCPNPMSGPSEIELRPYFEAADLDGFVSAEERATPRDGERATLGVA
jgi:hypothetical protein